MELLKEIGPYLAAGITAIIGYFSGKRKSKAEADITELEATQKAIEIWRKLALDLERQIKELREHVNKLEQENENLYQKIYELEKKQ